MNFINLLPIKVFGNSSKKSENSIDTSLFLQKHYLRSYYLESNIEADIDLKNQKRIEKVPDRISIREATSKVYVVNLFNDSSILKNTEQTDLNDRNTTNARFIQVNQWPQMDSHLAAKLYVCNAIDEPSLVRIKEDNDFNDHNLTNKNSNTLNTQAVKVNQVIKKVYLDQFHNDNERNRGDLGLSFHDGEVDLVKDSQDNDINDNKLSILDSIKGKRAPTSNNALANKNNIDDELDKNTFLRFNQTLENYLKVFFGNDTYNLTKYDKIPITEITFFINPNTGGYILPLWKN